MKGPERVAQKRLASYLFLQAICLVPIIPASFTRGSNAHGVDNVV